jgi:multidrug resistance efflux pump
MKINILYIFWGLALLLFFYIGRHLYEQSSHQLFGIAETEGQIIKTEYDVFIQKNYIKAGQKVKKGDTLLLLWRSDIDERTTRKLAEMNQIEVEKAAKNATLSKEKEILAAKQTALLTELQSKIKVLQSEIAVQKNIREALGDGKTSNNTIKEQEIKAIEDDIKQANFQYLEQLKLFDNQLVGNNNISTSKITQLQKELGFIDKERSKLVLLAPCDGFVEQVYVAENEIAQGFKDLLKINPYQPNKVIGFIHESVNIPYRLGDTVTLISSQRPEVTYRALLVGVSPKLVELPFRLRKFAEVKAWGREIYINLPPQNIFFIGEKVIIQMK